MPTFMHSTRSPVAKNGIITQRNPGSSARLQFATAWSTSERPIVTCFTLSTLKRVAFDLHSVRNQSCFHPPRLPANWRTSAITVDDCMRLALRPENRSGNSKLRDQRKIDLKY